MGKYLGYIVIVAVVAVAGFVLTYRLPATEPLETVAVVTPVTEATSTATSSLPQSTTTSSATTTSVATVKAVGKPVVSKPVVAATTSAQVVQPVVATTTPAVLPPSLASTTPKITGTISTSTKINVGVTYVLEATTTDARWPAVPEPIDRKINPKAVVALYCHDYQGGEWKGSGNIVHPDGYILTNRHVAENAKYCEVAMPGDSVNLSTRQELANFGAIRSVINITGWRQYKAVKYFVPPRDGFSALEREAADFAIMKISEMNDQCETFGKCGPIPTAFPYNPISNFHIATSTAPDAFPVVVSTDYYLPKQPNELLSYGYPSQGLGTGNAHVMQENLGYSVAYLPGDKKFPGYPLVMVSRTLYPIAGGSSGSGVFYRGHIIGLFFAAFNGLESVELVVPMPLISQVLQENNMDWVLAKN